MRRLSRKRKGKQKISWDGEDDEEDQNDELEEEAEDEKEMDAYKSQDEDEDGNKIQDSHFTKRLYNSLGASSSSQERQGGGYGAYEVNDGYEGYNHEDKGIEDDENLVTFVEVPSKETGSNGHDAGLCATNAEHMLGRVQFYTEDGRVDVKEVLDHLNAPGLQYQLKPGIWRDLKSMRSGLSRKRFQNMQDVYFRRTSLRDMWPWKSQSAPRGTWVDQWLVEGDTRKTYCARVSRLCIDKGNKRGVVGTAVRFENPYGLLLTAHHCCTFVEPSSGRTAVRKNLFAFGMPVDIVHLSSNYDLAFLLLKSGPYVGGFRFASPGEEKRGRPVRMISFPWHVDNAYGFDYANVAPTEVHGHIANLGPKEHKLPLFVDALATYMGGFAASPGGAVTLNSKVLVGMHVRAIWHQKGEVILPFKGRSKSSNQVNCKHDGPPFLSQGNISSRALQVCRESSHQYERDAYRRRKKQKMLDGEQQHNDCGAGGNSWSRYYGDSDCSTSYEAQHHQYGNHRRLNDVGSCSRSGSGGGGALQRNDDCSTSYEAQNHEYGNHRKLNNVGSCSRSGSGGGAFQRNSDARCSMYHGYLSTYLSVRHIGQEYDDFVASWTMDDGGDLNQKTSSTYISRQSHRSKGRKVHRNGRRDKRAKGCRRRGKRRSKFKHKRRGFRRRKRSSCK